MPSTALQVGYALAAEGRTRADGTPRNLLELAVLASWSDVRVVGLLSVLNPVVGVSGGGSAAGGRPCVGFTVCDVLNGEQTVRPAVKPRSAARLLGAARRGL